MTAYYNEFDPKAAAWLRELIRQGHIAPGDVDERSIADVRPTDLSGYRQCHFFAGIGVWSYALRRAGWSDDRPVWTGSCPCQPFSAAGKGGGFDDERHLWPHFHWLIAQCGPDIVFGEQVASKDGLAWIDLVQADLEGSGYASGAVDFCSAGVGAPHIRQRLYWFGERLEHAQSDGREQWRSEPSEWGTPIRRFVGQLGDAGLPRLEGQRGGYSASLGRDGATGSVAPTGQPDGVEDAANERLQGRAVAGGERPAQPVGLFSAGPGDDAGGLANADGGDTGPERQQRGGEQRQQPEDGGTGRLADNRGVGRTDGKTIPGGGGSLFGEATKVVGIGDSRNAIGLADATEQGREPWRRPAVESDGRGTPRVEPGRLRALDGAGRTGPTNGFWGAADWLHCRDHKWRPVEPGTFPLAHGAPARVGRLRGYGNAINAEAATIFIDAYLETKTIEISADADGRDIRLAGHSLFSDAEKPAHSLLSVSDLPHDNTNRQDIFS